MCACTSSWQLYFQQQSGISQVSREIKHCLSDQNEEVLSSIEKKIDVTEEHETMQMTNTKTSILHVFTYVRI